MSAQRRKICRRARFNGEHEAKSERIGMVIIVDPANWRLKPDTKRIQQLRSALCETRANMSLNLGLSFPFDIRDESRWWRVVDSGSGVNGKGWLRQRRRQLFVVVSLCHEYRCCGKRSVGATNSCYNALVVKGWQIRS
jgi:hypothetical protein